MASPDKIAFTSPEHVAAFEERNTTDVTRRTEFAFNTSTHERIEPLRQVARMACSEVIAERDATTWLASH